MQWHFVMNWFETCFKMFLQKELQNLEDAGDEIMLLDDDTAPIPYPFSLMPLKLLLNSHLQQLGCIFSYYPGSIFACVQLQSVNWWVGKYQCLKNLLQQQKMETRLSFDYYLSFCFCIGFWRNSEVKTEQEYFSYCVYFLVVTESHEKCAL